MTSSNFTHFDDSGRPQMVDVSEKAVTERIAVARALVSMDRETKLRIEEKRVHKGDVLSIAELAGIMGAKRTADLIPLCHPVPLTKVNVEAEWEKDGLADRAILKITATATARYRTGVEMEALTACTVAGLTVYDMCKAIDRGMTIESVQLLYKAGGKSGVYNRTDN